jgi:hypothetical protein
MSAQDTALDIAHSAGTGIAKGAIGLAGLPGDIGSLLSAGVDAAGNYLGADPARLQAAKAAVSGPISRVPSPLTALTGPGAADIQKGVEGYTGQFYQPQTTPGQYAQTIGEFAPATLAGPGGIGRRIIAGAVVPGAASETAGQLTAGTDAEPYARAAAALTAGAGAILASPGRTTTAALQGQLPAYVTPAHVQRAEMLINHAQARGVDLTWPEALSRITGRPVLTDMQRILESAPQSRTRMQDFFAPRPQQIQAASRAEIGNIAPPPANPTSIGREVGTAAEGAVNDVRGGINDIARAFYDAAGPIRLTPTEMAQVRAIPGYAEAADAVRNNVQLNRNVGHLPENSIGFLNEVKKYLDQQTVNSRSPLYQNPNMQITSGLGQDAAAVRNAAANAVRDPTRQYTTALAIEENLRGRVLQPLLDGPLGKLADRDIGTRDAINALFPKNPTANERQISDAVGAVAARNPGAASQLVRAHIEYTLNDAATNLQTGGNQALGAKLAVRLTGNPQQRANLQAAVEALPNGAARWRGMNDLLEVAAATGERQAKGSLTAFNTEELKSMGSGTHLAETLKTAASPGKWWNIVNDRVTKWQLGRNLDGLARIITDPASGPLFQRLAGLPRNSPQAGAIAARLILLGDASTANQRRQPDGQ